MPTFRPLLLSAGSRSTVRTHRALRCMEGDDVVSGITATAKPKTKYEKLEVVVNTLKSSLLRMLYKLSEHVCF